MDEKFLELYKQFLIKNDNHCRYLVIEPAPGTGSVVYAFWFETLQEIFLDYLTEKDNEESRYVPIIIDLKSGQCYCLDAKSLHNLPNTEGELI